MLNISRSDLVKHIPNFLSWLRLGTSVALFALLLFEHDIRVAQILVVGGIISDKLDGTLARWWRTESERGKKLETFIDPFFLAVGALYITLRCGFPWWFFLFGITVAVTLNIARLIMKIKKQKLFYKKSQLTRIGVGCGYFIMLWFLFALPYREQLIMPSLLLLLIATANYIRMMKIFISTAARVQ